MRRWIIGYYIWLLFIQQLFMIIYYVLGLLLGVGDTAVNKANKIPLLRSYIPKWYVIYFYVYFLSFLNLFFLSSLFYFSLVHCWQYYRVSHFLHFCPPPPTPCPTPGLPLLFLTILIYTFYFILVILACLDYYILSFRESPFVFMFFSVFLFWDELFFSFLFVLLFCLNTLY